MGDSLSSGHGISQSQSWTTLLKDKLKQHGHNYQVVNASITGDTTRGGLSRLPTTLERTRPDIVILELGGNDGLRGLSIKNSKENLDQMILMSRQSGAEILLLGIQLPHNYGPEYREKFHQIYLDLAAERVTALVPFFLEGVAETMELMQPDGIHPDAAAQPRILQNVWQGLGPLLQ